MANTKEEVSIRLGLDSSGISAGLSKAKGAVDRFGMQVGKHFKQIGGQLAAALGFQKLAAQLKDLTDEINNIDPTLDIEGRRARQKQEIFGGLSHSEREDIVQAQLNMEKAQDTLKMWVGKLFGAAGKVGTGLGGLAGGKGFTEAIVDAEVEAHSIQLKREKTEQQMARAKEKEMAAQKRIAEINDRYAKATVAAAADAVKLQAERLKIALRMDEVSNKGNKLAYDFKSALRDMASLSLSDAADLTDKVRGDIGLSDFRLSNKQMNDVNAVRRLEHDATQANISGDTGLSDKLTRQRLEMLKSMPWLKEADRNPLKSIYEAIEEQRKSMAELVDQAKTIGLNVSIVAVPLK